jgi:LuxR family maltose regulon positive regulatory protein
VAGTVRHARRALDLAAPEDHLIRGQGGAFLGLAAWADGNVAEALETFGTAIRSLHAAGNLVDELDATIVLADMWVALGRPGRARELYERGLQQATKDGEPYPRATADLHVGLAELDRELDDLANARRHLDTARVLAQRATITENRHRWFVAMAQVGAAAGDDEAGPLLDRAEALYRSGFYPEIRPIPATRARLAIATGDLATAYAWVRSRSIGVGDDPDYLREYEHLTLVRLLLAEDRIASRSDEPGTGAGQVGDALVLLDRLHAAAAAARRDGSLVEIRALQALTHHAQGDEPRAVAALEQALRGTPEPDGHVRLYLDEGPPMLDLLHRAVTEHGVSLPERLARRLEGSPTPAEGTLPAQPLAAPLSQRELDVLRLLDSELTGPDIARQLYVSLNTLRTHTKRIFTKLDVNNRSAAVRRAHQLGLL